MSNAFRVVNQLARRHEESRCVTLGYAIALGQGPGAAGRASMTKVIISGQMLCLVLSLPVTPVS